MSLQNYKEKHAEKVKEVQKAKDDVRKKLIEND